MNEETLTQLYLDVEVMKREVAALRHVATALAVRLCELSPESDKRTKLLLAAMVPYSNHLDTPPSGDAVKVLIEQIQPLTLGEVDPVEILLVLSLMGEDAGPDRLDALTTWMSQATDDELAQDIEQLLKKLRGKQG